MQSPTLKNLFDSIAALNIDIGQKNALLDSVAAADKEFLKKNFMVERTYKDKEIALRLLNNSLNNLEAANHRLKDQKLLLEEKSVQLETHVAALENSYNELEQFSYIASHDLKSPLRNIASYAQLLKRRYGGKLDNEADEFIGFIVSGVQQMSDVIANLLEFSRIGVEAKWGKADFNEVLMIVSKNLEKEVESSGAKLVFDENFPSINSLKSGMVQLFQHLLSNSITYCSDKKPEIKISHFEQANHWVFEIEDNGTGIEKAFHNKIFKPFQRLHLDKPGMGMGLAICRKIVQKHGGEIWFDSEPGVGTTVKFSISKK